MIPRVALALAAAALVLLPAHPAEGGGKHRKYPKREEAEEVPPGPAVEEEAPQAPRPRYPLYLDYGEAVPSLEYGGPSVPRLEDLLPLVSPDRFRADPWGCLEIEEDKRLRDHRRDRLRNRLFYLKEKAALLHEVIESASGIADMAESLAAAGEWSAADCALASANLRRLELLRDEIGERAADMRRLCECDIGTPYFLPASDGSPRTLPEWAAGHLLRMHPVELRVAAYVEEILPALEEVATEATRAHQNGQVGLSMVIQRRGQLFAARAEHLEQVWLLYERVLDLEEAADTYLISWEETP